MRHGNANLFRLGAAADKASYPSRPDAAWPLMAGRGETHEPSWTTTPEGSVESTGLANSAPCPKQALKHSGETTRKISCRLSRQK